MGLIVPQISPYFLNVFNFKNPGLIFLAGQISMPFGALLSGYISDKTLHARYIIIVKILISSISIYILSLLPNLQGENIYEYAIVLWCLLTFSIGGTIPLVDVLFMQSGNDPLFFGHFRLYGTLGFLVVNIPLLFLSLNSYVYMSYAFIFFLISSIIILFLPVKRNPRESEKSAAHWSQMIKLLRSPLMIFFLLMMFFFFIGYSSAEYVISSYLSNINFIMQPIPFIWIIGTLVEIIFFIYSPYLIKKNGIMPLLSAGFAAGTLRNFILWMFIPGGGVLIWQFLHGIQFSGGYMGSLLFLEKKTHPRRLATAQAMYLILARSTGTGLGAYFLGNLASENKYDMVFLLAFLGSFTALLMFFFFKNYQLKFKNFLG